MFNKVRRSTRLDLECLIQLQNMESVQPALSALKKLALLEPDLVMPALMERVVPSLQGLEEVSPA